MKAEEAESLICNVCLELENTNLYELTLEIKREGGTVLDLNTDRVICEFEKFPFKLNENNNILGYYHDNELKNPTYKLEERTSQVK